MTCTFLVTYIIFVFLRSFTKCFISSSFGCSIADNGPIKNCNCGWRKHVQHIHKINWRSSNTCDITCDITDDILCDITCDITSDIWYHRWYHMWYHRWYQISLVISHVISHRISSVISHVISQVFELLQFILWICCTCFLQPQLQFLIGPLSAIEHPNEEEMKHFVKERRNTKIM